VSRLDEVHQLFVREFNLHRHTWGGPARLSEEHLELRLPRLAFVELANELEVPLDGSESTLSIPGLPLITRMDDALDMQMKPKGSW